MKSLGLSWVTLALAMGICSISSASAAPGSSCFMAADNASPTVSYSVASKPSRQSKFALSAFIETNINSGTDGGLYAEIIRNRAFQNNVVNATNKDNALGKGSLQHWSEANQYTNLALTLENSLSPALPQSVVIGGQKTEACGIANAGWDGISVAQQNYKLSFYARSYWQGGYNACRGGPLLQRL